MTCPQRDELEAWRNHLLPEDRTDEVAKHIATCDVCGSVLAEAHHEHSTADHLDHEHADTRTAAGIAPSVLLKKEKAPLLPAGASIGRYLVISSLGEGGMGAVYLAYDPRLDRRVAVKLLHTGSVSNKAADSRARLEREAQAGIPRTKETSHRHLQTVSRAQSSPTTARRR